MSTRRSPKKKETAIYTTRNQFAFPYAKIFISFQLRVDMLICTATKHWQGHHIILAQQTRKYRDVCFPRQKMKIISK